MRGGGPGHESKGKRTQEGEDVREGNGKSKRTGERKEGGGRGKEERK